jgi:general secretion pathway protein L
LESSLTAFDEAELPAGGVDLAAGGLNRVARQLARDQAGLVLWLDIDLFSATLLVRFDGKPVLFRGLPHGLASLAGAVGAELTTPAAVRATLNGLDPSGLSVEDRQALSGAVADMAREVELSLGAAGLGDVRPERIVLSGEGAEPDWLAAQLGKQLEAPAMRISSLDTGNMNFALPAPAPSLERMAVPLGLALRGAPSLLGAEPGLNFHQDGPLACRRNLDLRRIVGPVAAAVMVLLLGFGLSTGTDIYLKQQRLAGLEERIDAAMEEALPGTGGRFRRSQYASILRGRLNELRGTQSSAQTGRGATATLADISTAVPDKLAMTISSFYLDPYTVRMSGRSDAFATVEQIKKNLEAVQGLGEVEIKGASADPGGGGIQFQMEISRQDGGAEGGAS